MKSLRFESVVLTLALAVTACGSGGSSSDGSSGKQTFKPANVEDAKKTLAAYLKAFVEGDSKKSCALETDEYTKTSIAEAIKEDYVKEGATCEGLNVAARALYKAFGLGPEDLVVETIEVKSKTVDSATLIAKYSDGDATTYRLAFADDKWLIAAEIDEEETSDADTARWLENWCSVDKGQTRAEAIALMGEPTGEFTKEDDATPQLNWDFGAYSFTAFMDTDGIVNSFYANYDSLGATDRAKLTCPADR